MKFAEKHLSGVGLAMTRPEVEKLLGKKRKTKKLFDKDLGQTVRIDNYDGLDIIYDSKGLVIKVSVLKPDFAGPKGLKTGDAKEQVIQLLGRGRTGPASLMTYFPLDDDNQQLTIQLDNNIVNELSLQKISAGT